jgi:hypothetical protein
MLKNNGYYGNKDNVFYLCLKEINIILHENDSSLIEVSTIDIQAYNRQVILSTGFQGKLSFSFDEDRTLNQEELRIKVIKMNQIKIK